MRKTKEMQKGITLVALVITVIILLILAGISIMSLTNTGIFQKAQEAKKKTAEAEANQKATLDEYERELIKYGDKLTASDIAKAENKDEIYGKSVEYTPAGVTTDVGWKIFYSDGTNIYLIADNYVERENLPASTKDGVATEHKPNAGDSSYKRSAYFSNVYSDYVGSESILTSLQKLNNSFFEQKFTSTNPNMKSVAYMMDTTAWSGYKDAEGKAEYAIGGPSLEILFESYNQKYKISEANKYKAKATDTTGYVGYQISTDGGTNWDTYITDSFKYLKSNDSLYVISSQLDAYAMVLSTPTASNDGDGLMGVFSDGNICRETPYYTTIGFRPLVCLNSNAILQETNGTYIIQ